MVSVRPCLKADVEADSYVETRLPCIRMCANWKAICIIPSGDSLSPLRTPEVNTSVSHAARSVDAIVEAKRDAASVTAAFKSGVRRQSRREGGETGDLAVERDGSERLSLYTSLKKRSTATPSPHECSKLTAAFAFADTISWKDLSSHRSTPLPCKKQRHTSVTVLGASVSREMEKSAESIASMVARLSGRSDVRRAAHSSRGSDVRKPTASSGGAGWLSAASMIACIAP
mmetsp:Transcript_43073/g.104731  ORF Transcript_43073/g.104731 Transcript_43073/m.104731 type:complete len:230 (+) Transcript_43073:638-1327(+)